MELFGGDPVRWMISDCGGGDLRRRGRGGVQRLAGYAGDLLGRDVVLDREALKAEREFIDIRQFIELRGGPVSAGTVTCHYIARCGLAAERHELAGRLFVLIPRADAETFLRDWANGAEDGTPRARMMDPKRTPNKRQMASLEAKGLTRAPAKAAIAEMVRGRRKVLKRRAGRPRNEDMRQRCLALAIEAAGDLRDQYERDLIAGHSDVREPTLSDVLSVVASRPRGGRRWLEAIPEPEGRRRAAPLAPS